MAFQQDRNPLIQLNQDNIENTEKRRPMPPTLPTKNATIQQVVYPVVNKYHLIVRGLFSNFKAPNIINNGSFKIRK